MMDDGKSSGNEWQDINDKLATLRAEKADLLAALRGALPYLEHSLKFYRFQRPGHEFWPNREEAEGNIRQARAAIEKAS